MLIVKKQLRNSIRVYRVVIEDWAENLWFIFLNARSSDQALHKAIMSYNMEPTAHFNWRVVKHPEVDRVPYLESLNHWNKIPKERRPSYNYEKSKIQQDQQINNNPAPEKRKRSRLSKTRQPDPLPAEPEDLQE